MTAKKKKQKKKENEWSADWRGDMRCNEEKYNSIINFFVVQK